jgi:hypothetical protein
MFKSEVPAGATSSEEFGVQRSRLTRGARGSDGIIGEGSPWIVVRHGNAMSTETNDQYISAQGFKCDRLR